MPRFLIDWQQELDPVVVGGQPLFFEEVAELRHVVGVDAEDAERLQRRDVLRALDAFRELGLAAALEAHVEALEAHAAAEELDDLRALSLADVHQAHRRHAPTAPALGELLGADQQVDRRMRLVDLVKERARELPLAAWKAVLLAELHQLGVVADVDDAEGVVVGAEAQGDLAGGALQVLHIERPPPGALNRVASVSSKICAGGEAARVEIRKSAGEEVLARRRDEPLVQHTLDALDALRSVCHVAGQELQDLDDVRCVPRGQASPSRCRPRRSTAASRFGTGGRRSRGRGRAAAAGRRRAGTRRDTARGGPAACPRRGSGSGSPCRIRRRRSNGRSSRRACSWRTGR